MQFTQEPAKPFGQQLLAIEVESKLSAKTPLIFRLSRLLQFHECVRPSMRALAELCLDEAITNAMMHGNQLDPKKKVRVQLFCDDERWGAVIEDEGEGFDPDVVPSMATESLAEEQGRGIFLMNGYLDELVFASGGRQALMIRHRETAEKLPEPTMEAAELEEPPPPPEKEAAPSYVDQEALEIVELEDAELKHTIKAVREGDIAVVEVLPARLSDANVDTFREEVEAEISTHRSLVIDMGRVEYISSPILGALVAFSRLVLPKGGQIKVCAAQPVVLKVLQSVRLDRLLDPQPNREAALLKLRQET